MAQASQGQCRDLLERTQGQLEELETVLNSISEGFIIVDSNGMIIARNFAAVRILGFSGIPDAPSDLKQYTAVIDFQTLDGKSIPFENWPLGRVLRSQNFTNYEMKAVRKDKPYWAYVSYNGVCIKDKDGRLKMAVLTSSDITSRKIVEMRLSKSEKEYRAIFELAGSGTAQIDPQTGRFVRVNQKFCSMLGYTPDELTAKTILDVTYEDDMQLSREMFEKIKGGEVNEYTLEKRQVRKDGHIIWVLIATAMVRDDQGRAILMTESLHDITERKKLQQELGETQERLAVATSSARVGVWHWDIANNELTWNDQTKELFGLRADAKLDYHAFVEKIHPADREQMKQQVTSATKAGKDYETEYRLMLPDGSTRWILSRGKAFHDSSGNPIAMTGIVMDITERKIQQEQLEKLNRQFEARTKEYEAVISFVSHDLRSPIVNVKGFGGELRRDLEMLEKVLSDVELPQKAKRDVEMVLGESVPESLGFIEKSAETMEILLTSLVQVTRAGLAAVSPEKIDMDELIANILASLEFKIQQAGATVRVDKLPPCTADKPQAGRIFSNLIDNALKYLDKSRPGSIRIWGIASGNESMYCVEDNGLGIAPEYQKRIFEIFYRVSQKVQGEGIGLAMVKRMVDRNNGRIWVESEQGKGSRFFVALPK